jgi:hypothetical protein
VFKPKHIKGGDQSFYLTYMCLIGFIASVLAISAAGRDELDVGLILASLGGLYIYYASS